jgi:hypothetical protein
MAWRRWILGTVALTLLSGCNTMQAYQASVEQGCRQQANGKSARYNDCMRKAAAADREALRHQDEEWRDSIEDAGRFPVVPLALRQRP